ATICGRDTRAPSYLLILDVSAFCCDIAAHDCVEVARRVRLQRCLLLKLSEVFFFLNRQRRKIYAGLARRLRNASIKGAPAGGNTGRSTAWGTTSRFTRRRRHRVRQVARV